MKKALGLAAGIVLVAAAFAMAQETVDAGKAPGGRGAGGARFAGRSFAAGGDIEGLLMRSLFQDPRTAEALGLTPEQGKEIKATLSTSDGESTELRRKMEQAASRQIELLSQDTPDEAAIFKVVDEIGAMRSDIAKLRMKQLLAVLKKLTPEQRARLRELTKTRIEEARDRMKEGRGQRREHPPKAPASAPVAPPVPATPAPPPVE